MPPATSFRPSPPLAASTLPRSASVSCASSRASRTATLDNTSGSTLPRLTARSSASKGTVFFWSIGRESVLSLLAHADGVDDDEVVLGVASGVTAQVVGLDDAHAAALHLLEEAAAL
jgi:hypothetical protein